MNTAHQPAQCRQCAAQLGCLRPTEGKQHNSNNCLEISVIFPSFSISKSQCRCQFSVLHIWPCLSINCTALVTSPSAAACSILQHAACSRAEANWFQHQIVPCLSGAGTLSTVWGWACTCGLQLQARHSAAVRSYYPTLAHALFSRGIFSVQ